jgi:glycosyltransferase involved in cell wall biosynthesis
MVSVLMTSYNREMHIAESITSVLQQNFEDYEFIIVDDASNDSTWEIINDFAKRDKRIRPYQNAENKGDYPNRNIAASYATRKYIKYLDSDDILFPGALSHFVNTMELNPSISIGLIGIGLGLSKFETIILQPKDTYRQIFFRGNIIGCCPSFSIIRTDEFRKLGGFNTKRHLSDFELWLKVLSTNSVCLFDESLVYWRKHEHQEFTIGEKTNYHFINSFHIYLTSLHNSSCPLCSDEKNMAIRNLKNRYSRTILLSFLSGRIFFSKKLFKVTHLTFYDLIKSISKNQYPIYSLKT